MPASDKTGAAAENRQRIDKWLWFARVVKTREAAASLVETGHVRINGNKVLKPGHDVKAGDVLTIVLHTRVRVLHIEGWRRGAVRRRPRASSTASPPCPPPMAKRRKKRVHELWKLLDNRSE